MRRWVLLAICLLVVTGALLAFYVLRASGPDTSIQSSGEFSNGPVAAQVITPTPVQPVDTPTVVPSFSNPPIIPAISPVPPSSPSSSDSTAADILSKIINNLLPTPTSNNLTPAPQLNVQALEKQIHDGINAERAAAGITLLAWDPLISKIARRHSQDMAARGYFDHTTPEGLGPGDRLVEGGYTIATGYAENIFWCSQIKSSLYKNGVLIYSEYFSLEEIANFVISGWMSSPGHQLNILNDYLPKEGVGIALSADGKIYITEDFG